MSFTEGQIRSSILGVSMSYQYPGKKPSKQDIKDGVPSFDKCLESLKRELIEQGEIFVKSTPFYKDGVRAPAGYVIETDRQTIVSYHGTQIDNRANTKEVSRDFKIRKSIMSFGGQECGVHAGFKEEYEDSKVDLYKVLNKIESSNPLVFSGHSLGGAVASIAALDASANGELKGKEVGAVIIFGSPRVFFRSAAHLYNKLGISDKTVRIEQSGDPITKIPIKSLGYAHVGRKIKLDSKVGKTHSEAAYRSIAGNIDGGHIESADRAESINVSNYDVYAYMNAVMNAKGNLLRKVRDVIKSALSFEVGLKDSSLPNNPDSPKVTNAHKHDKDYHDSVR